MPTCHNNVNQICVVLAFFSMAAADCFFIFLRSAAWVLRLPARCNFLRFVFFVNFLVLRFCFRRAEYACWFDFVRGVSTRLPSPANTVNPAT